MKTFIEILKLVLAVVPVIISLIKTLESEWPQAGLGKEKLAVVRQIFESAYKAVEESMPSIEKVWVVVQGVIDSMVSLFNKAGWGNEPAK